MSTGRNQGGRGSISTLTKIITGMTEPTIMLSLLRGSPVRFPTIKSDSLITVVTVAKMSAAAPISAAQAIGEYLQSPDDLLKIAAFRKKLEKEKASIDARLKSGVKEQLDATREGLRKLLSTRNNVQVIKDEMQTIDRACSDPHNVVPTFDQISRVSMLSPYIHN
jgi:hypothetical protein